jgi:arylsulfatase A-like enzyme/tetratricopeptide (TPR) repeat protein
MPLLRGSLTRWLVLLGLVVSVGAIAVVVVELARGPFWKPGDTLRPLWTAKGIEKPNVILVSLDTTRADHLGCYGDKDARTPTLDELAGRGVLFAQAATPAPLTLPAHSSLMTGFYPTFHGVRLNGTTALGASHTTLAEALAQDGYQTGAFVGAFVLDSRWGLNQGFRVYDDQFDLKKFKHLDLAGVQRPANEVVDAALRWLDGQKQVPFFAWVHLYDAHSPYEPPEPFVSEFRSRGLPGLYDGEISFVDQQLARLLAWLQGAGLDQRTVVLIVGDHGEALGAHGEGTHGYFIYDEAVRVPFIVATPFDELRGLRVDAQVSLVDVFPTVLALAGIESTVPVNGRSLLPLMFKQSPDDHRYAYSEAMTSGLQYGWSELHALRSPRYKFIQAPRPELYDLVADPGEKTNVFGQHRQLASDMARELDRLMTGTAKGAPAPEAANLDKETLERLASLGYVGGSSSRKTTAGSALADPKDKLEVFTAVQRAGEFMVKDDYAQAAQALEAALRSEPAMPQARLMLGSSYSQLGRTADAKAQFDRVLKEDPQSVQGLIGLANLLLEEGRTDDVVTLCKRTLSLDERNAQAYVLLGDVYIARKEPTTALAYLEKAVEIQPKITQNRLNLAACLIDAKEFSRAQATLSEILAAHPKFPGAQFNLGVLYEEQNRPDDARTAYAAEVGTFPASFKARFNLGKLLAASGQWPESIEQMREVVRIAPRRPEGYLFAARGLLHESGSLDEVQSLAERGLSLARTPDLKALGWFLMADVFSRRQQPENVERALRNARLQASAASRESPHATSSP